MNLILPTEEELKLKINSLPPSIKNALNSEDTLFVARQIGRSFRLEDEQITAIEQLVGMVLLGYVNISDIATVIEDDIDTPAEWATLIASELRERIFAPIEKDLLKANAPQQDVFTPKPIGLPKEEKPLASEAKPLAVPSPIKIQPGTVAPQLMPKVPAPSPIMPSRVAPITPPAPIKTAGEKTTPVPTPITTAPATPFILHKEETVRPITGEKSFKSFEASVPSAIKREEAAPSISARLELGAEEQRKKEPVIAKTEVPSPRTVHYSNLRTSLSPTTQEPQGAKPSAPAPMPFSEIPQSAPVVLSETKPASGGAPLFPKAAAEPESYLHPLPDLWPKTGASPSASPAPSVSSAQATPGQITVAEQKPPAITAEDRKESDKIAPKPIVNLDGNTVDLRSSSPQAPNAK